MSLSRLCGVRLLAKSEANPIQRTIDCFETSRIRASAKGPVESCRASPYNQAGPTYTQEVPSDERSPVERRMPTSDSMTTFVCDTKRAFLSEGPSCQLQLAHIYRALGEQDRQLRQLQLAIRQTNKLTAQQELSTAYQDDGFGGLPRSSLVEFDAVEDDDVHAVDVFLNCVSRFFADDSASSIKKVQANFAGSPEYYFESSHSWHPKQYAIASQISQKLFLYAMMQFQGSPQRAKYFLLYAETPWRWHRVIVIATLGVCRGDIAVSQVSVPDNNECTRKLLAPAIERNLTTYVSRVKRFASVTTLSISLRGKGNSENVPGSPRIEDVGDQSELETSQEGQAMQDIQELGCAIFLESDIVVCSRIASSIFEVSVGGRRYTEQKVPFATVGREGESSYHDFLIDLKKLHSLRDYAGIAQFVGVVLDDTRQYLKSYLSESPSEFSLAALFAVLKKDFETIPCELRQAWAV